jgi:magnesium transporter
MVAESSTLQAMCRRRQNSIKDLRQDHENQTTDEMNKKIVRLNEVVKRLTAITVILMLPTIIESHFGMNFVNMPELKLAWGYGASIGLEVSLMLVAFLLFRKYKWL